MGKKLYIVSGGLTLAGRHKWFGNRRFGSYRGFANFLATRNLRHANAQYKRLKPAIRQMDLRENGKAKVLRFG